MLNHRLQCCGVIALCCVTLVLIDGKRQPSFWGSASASETSSVVITRSNSPQYAKDFDAIDALGFSICGTAVNPDGTLNWKKPPWRMDLRPRDADAAHTCLRKLLADYPLHRPFLGLQSRFRTAASHTMCFYEGIDNDNNEVTSVFTITVFEDLGFMDVE